MNMPTANFRVLLVDDDPSILALLSEFSSAVGFSATCVESAFDAMDVLEEEDFTLVVTDVHMPGKSGVDLLGYIKKHEPSLPVVLLTGLPKVDAAVDCLRMGAMDYLAKPFSMERLAKIYQTAADPRAAEKKRRIGGYEILRQLGEGSMGIVFEVTRHDANYALKILKQTAIASIDGPEILARFKHEAQAAAAVKHRNVASVHDYGVTSDELPFLVMDLHEGQSLGEMIDEGREMEYWVKAEIIYQVALGLEAIHQSKIMHRDIKPGNIIVDDKGVAKITDFGIAHIPNSTITVEGDAFGTPQYMSPEAFETAHVGRRSDIFSLGLTAYEFFTGKRAFDTEDLLEMINKITNEKPLEPRKIDPEFPMELQLILGKMLRKKKEERYQTAMELSLALQGYLEKTKSSSIVLDLRHKVSTWRRRDWS